MDTQQHKKGSVCLSVLVILGLFLAACSAPAAPATTTEEAVAAAATEAQPAATTSTEAAPAGEPSVGGKLVFGMTQEPDSLDPHMTAMGDDVSMYIGIALIAKDKDNQYVPWAAESWEAAPDGLTLTFKLRKDMKFQDGSPLTAKDFVYTYRRALDPASTGATSQMLAGVTDISASDDYTLVLTLSAPNFYLLDNLTNPGYMQPVSEAWVTSQGDALGHNPMSAGPYKMKEWVVGDHITLERNPDYTWAPAYAHQGPAYIQEMVFRFIPEMATLVAGLEAGEIDHVRDLEVQHVSRIEASGAFNVLPTAFQGCSPYLSLNVAKAPFDDLKVRQAFGYAIDSQTIIDVVLQGNGTVQSGPLSSSMTGYWPGVEQIGYGYDLEKAKALLAEAGYTPGADGILAKGDQPLKLELLTSSEFVKTAQMLQEQFKQIGVQVSIVQQEFAVMMNDILQGNYNLALFNYGYSNGGILPMIFHSRMEGTMNPGHVKDPDLDLLLDQINTEIDGQKQQEALNQAQRIIMENAYMLPMYNPTIHPVLSKKVQNFTYSTKNNKLYLEDAYIK